MTSEPSPAPTTPYGDPPAPYVRRPLSLADAQGVYEIIRDSEVHDVGEAVIDLEDIVGDWQRPSFDVAAQTVGLERDGVLVAYAEVHRGGRADAHVRPDHRGRGLGTWLAGWVAAEAARQGGTVVGQPVLGGSDADRLLDALGWRVRWTSWVLRLPEGRDIDPQPLPSGYTVRGLEPGEEPLAYGVVERAFSEWPDRTPTAYDDWAATTVLRPGFDLSMLRLVTAPDGEVVGACVAIDSGDTAYVDQLAVAREHRGLGLARALLVDAFARGRARGRVRCELSTDSRTGALGLYERVGMVVTSTWVNRATDV